MAKWIIAFVFAPKPSSNDAWSLSSILVTSVSVILSFLISLYFYNKSIRKRRPCYFVHPLRARLYDPTLTGLSDLRILHRGTEITGQSVVAARVYFWNAGEEPIKKDDILGREKHLVIHCGDDTEVLGATIVKASRENAVLGLSISPGNLPNSVNLTFDILEKDDGAALQIVFKGPINTRIQMTGKTLDANRIAEVKGILESVLRSIARRSVLQSITRHIVSTKTTEKAISSRLWGAWRTFPRRALSVFVIFWGVAFITAGCLLTLYPALEQSFIFRNPSSRTMIMLYIVSGTVYSLCGFAFLNLDREQKIPNALRE